MTLWSNQIKTRYRKYEWDELWFKENEWDGLGLKELNETDYCLKEMNEMDNGLKEMNDNVAKVEVMWGWVMMSWCDVEQYIWAKWKMSDMKSIAEQRDG